MVLLEQEQWDLVSHRLLHRQKAMKYIYAISMMNLLQTARTKSQKDSRKESQKAKWIRTKLMQSLLKLPQVQKTFVQMLI